MRISTILVFAVLAITAFDQGIHAEETGTSAEELEFEVTLTNGLYIQAVGYSIEGDCVYLYYPSGSRSKFKKEDIDLSSLPPAEVAAVPSTNPPEEPAKKEVGAEKESFESLREAASSVHLSADHIEIAGSPAPTPNKSPAGPTDRTHQSTDDGSDYLETLIVREEEEHQQALIWYEEQIRQLADLRSELVRAWNRASAACEGGTFFGGQAYGIVANSWESWRVDVSAYGWIDNSTTPICRALMADAEALAYGMVDGLNQMSGQARKNGILPGEARRILGFYGFRL